jgi:hypothetical protein
VDIQITLTLAEEMPFQLVRLLLAASRLVEEEVAAFVRPKLVALIWNDKSTVSGKFERFRGKLNYTYQKLAKLQ